MKQLLVLALVMCFELVLISLFYDPYPHGEILDVRYRQKARVDAYFDFQFHPSAAGKARWNEELTLMRRYVAWVTTLKVVLLIAVNGVLIYYFMDDRYRRAAPRALTVNDNGNGISHV